MIAASLLAAATFVAKGSPSACHRDVCVITPASLPVAGQTTETYNPLAAGR